MRVGHGRRHPPPALAECAGRSPPQDDPGLSRLRTKAERPEGGNQVVAAAADQAGELCGRLERPGVRQALRPRQQPLQYVDADRPVARDAVAARLIKAARRGRIGR